MARNVLLGLLIILFTEITLDFNLSLAPGMSVKNAVLYAFVMVLAIRAAIGGGPASPGLTRVHLCFVLMLCCATLSWAFTPSLHRWPMDYDPAATLVNLKTLLIDHYLFFLAFLYGIRSRQDAVWVAAALMGFVAISNVITLIDVFNIPDLGIIHERADSRVSGPLGESNQYAAFLVLFLPGIVALAYRARGLRRVIYGIGMLASVAVLLLTTSRGAMVGLFCGLVGTGWYLRHYLPKGEALKKLLMLFALVVVVTAAIGVRYGDLFYDRFVGKADLENLEHSSSGRTENWTTALGTQADRPGAFIWGVGWNSYKLMFDDRASHNTYIGYLFELGVIGLMLFLALLASLFRVTRRAIALAPPEQRIELMLFTFGFISLLVSVFFVNLYKPWLFVWAYVGLMMRVATSVIAEAHAPDPASQPATALPLPGGQGSPA
jgi:O-antigen ligase